MASKIQETEYLELDSLKSIMNIIKLYPKATEESNNELLMKYRNGDKDAQELLVKTNLRLVVFQAKEYMKHNDIHSYEFIDIIQEGLIGFMNAINTYDVTKGEAKFSTYAIVCIKNAINSSLGDNDRTIRRPRYLLSAMNNYRQIVAKCHANCTEIPDEKQLCRMLNITENTLKNIQNDYMLNTSSLNAPLAESLNRDDDSLNLEEIIVAEDNSCDSLLDGMINNQLLWTLKKEFSPYYYYILYHRVLSPDKVKQAQIAQKLCISTQEIARVQNTLWKD